MHHVARHCIGILIGSAMLAASPATALAGDELSVVSFSPVLHDLDAPRDSVIQVTFDRAVDPATFDDDSFHVFGRWSGTTFGSFSFTDNNHVVTLTPDEPFSAGEMVFVQLSHDLAAMDGSMMRSAGYFFQFWTAAAPTPLPELNVVANMTTRLEGEATSRSYGGIGSDLNNDGWLDITVVNEDSADLRVFLNTADGTGLMHPFLEPPFPVEDRASPSEPADFNRDGNTDICVANINPDTVSILLGNGDGTFGAQQVIDVGDAPRGIAAIDVDGDGDTDIVNTNSSGSTSCSVLLNDGTGVFSAPIYFDAGIFGEWSMMAADMNEDGIADLVVGSRFVERVVVCLGNGDGTFTPLPAVDIGGASWVIALGDVDGDGHVDVNSANSSSNTGSFLRGNGDGTLQQPVTFGTDNFPLSTDLGDIDGDGDLDWLASCYNGDFWLFLNDGSGHFTFYEEFDAPTAGSCALFLDLDNDNDNDLALIDELADRLILVRNDTVPEIPGDLNDSGTVDVEDLLILLGDWGDCPRPCPPVCDADINGDCTVDVDDLLTLLGNWS